MNKLNRRKFLGSTALAAAGSVIPAGTASAKKSQNHKNRIAVATYSFWRFKEGLKLSMLECIDKAAEMGFDGLDVLHIQMHKTDDQYLQEIKRRAMINGVDLCGLSIHQGFVTPDKEKRQKNIDHTIEMIEMAYSLEFPACV